MIKKIADRINVLLNFDISNIDILNTMDISKY